MKWTKVMPKVIVAFLLTCSFTFASSGRVLPVDPQTLSDGSVIYLPGGHQIDTRSTGSTILQTDEPRQGIRVLLVHFDGPIYDHQRCEIEALGAKIDGYLPHYTYLVRYDTEIECDISNVDGVSWVGEYLPEYKISPEVDLRDASSRQFTVLLYPGIDGDQIRQEIEVLGGELLSWQQTSAETVLRVMIPAEDLPELAELEEVSWIENAPRYQSFNADAQWVVQTWVEDDRRIWDQGLTGEGQIVNSTDTGLKTSHDVYRDPEVSISDWGDFPDHRKVISYQPGQQGFSTFGDEIGHGTGTACCLAGNDKPVGGDNPNIGMAPDAKIYFIDAGGPGGALAVGNDLEATWAKAYDGNEAGGARISSNSWGDPYTVQYDAACSQADRLMWNRPDYLVFVSAGNLPQATHTVNPADAKNVVCVGATMNGTGATSPAPYTTPGPAGDGRVKPEIVVPGSITTATFESDDAFTHRDGTSAACPIAAGNATLIRQYFTDGYYPSGSPSMDGAMIPSAALIKAMLINSVEIDFAGKNVPDASIGWGRANIDNVLYFPGDSRILDVTDYSNGLETGQQYQTEITVEDGSEPFRITLVWTDYPAEAGANPTLVNDLNLEVESPSGTAYKGNHFEVNQSVSGGDFDDLNPAENVFVNDPETGVWQINVVANNVPQGPQPFALAVTGGLERESGISEDNPAVPIPGNISLENNHIRFYSPVTEQVRLEVWDITGRRIQTLLSGVVDAGSHNLEWDTQGLSSGTYFVTLRFADQMHSTKAVVIR